MTGVVVFGTFDVLHPGHLALLKHAAGFGDVTVSLTPDALCRKYKGHDPVNTFAKRAARLERISFVQQVVPSDMREHAYDVLARIHPQFILLGYDQQALGGPLTARLRELGLNSRVVVARPYRGNLYHGALIQAALKA